MNFTGSPIEYMMQHNRASRIEDGGSKKNLLPPEHPCYGCSYAKETGCIGYCIKKLMSKGDAAR